MSILHSSKKSEIISAEGTEIQTIDGQQFEVKIVAEFEVTPSDDTSEFTGDDHPVIEDAEFTSDDFDEDDEDA